MIRITVWDINPEPYKSTGIPHRGKPVKDGKLEAFQEALADEVRGMVVNEDDMFMDDEFLYVSFYFWRSSQHGKPADATNLQKATEDALQGILYYNDKHNLHVESMICEQAPDTRPSIMIRIREFDPRTIPDRGDPPSRPTKFEGTTYVPPEEGIFG